MFPDFPKIDKGNWKQFLRVSEFEWDDGETNICKGQAVQDLIVKLGE